MIAARRALLTVALVVGASACGDDGGDADGDGASRYESVTDLADGLTEAGLTCTLEYEGLRDGAREVSLCTVQDELAELSVWDDPASAASTAARADAEDDPLVAGENWTIDVQSAKTAAAVAEALGGRVHGG